MDACPSTMLSGYTRLERHLLEKAYRFGPLLRVRAFSDERGTCRASFAPSLPSLHAAAASRLRALPESRRGLALDGKDRRGFRASLRRSRFGPEISNQVSR